MKQPIEVKMPGSAKDLRIKHFASMAFAPVNDNPTDSEKILFLSTFTGLRYNQCLDFRINDVNKMTALALRAIAQMDLKSKLPKEITIGKQKFYLVDPNKVGIGWHIDMNNSAKKNWIKKDPVRLACLFYLPEGFNYSDIDENNNITHPIDSRYQLFADEFPLDLFIRASGFFLSRSLNSMMKSMVVAKNLSLKQRISLVTNLINPTHGKRLSKQSPKPSTSHGTKP